MIDTKAPLYETSRIREWIARYEKTGREFDLALIAGQVGPLCDELDALRAENAALVKERDWFRSELASATESRNHLERLLATAKGER